jgi:membrane fusion protein (multidrug efflux system)
MASTTSTRPRSRLTGKRGLLILLVIAIIAAAAYAVVARPWESRAARVDVEIVASGPITQLLEVNGRVAAANTVKIRPAVAAQAIDVRVEAGDEVQAGDLLVQLDGAANTQVDQAQAALDAGLVKQQQAQTALDRVTALGENASRAQREDAELQLQAAAEEVKRLAAALDQARNQLAQYSITSPLTGVVLTRGVDRGQLVDVQSELFTVADLTQLLVETDVDELYSARIRKGLKVLLRPVGETVARHGTLVFAMPTVDPGTGGRAIKIAFDDPADLPVGLTVNANIIVDEIEAALSIPRSAIVTEGVRSHVLVIRDGLATEQEVQFSDWPAERVVVTSGLTSGDAVILDPQTVEPGKRVEIR